MLAKDPATGWRLRVDFLGERPVSVRRLRGELEPFGGWVMNGPRPLPAASYEVRQEPGTRWVATLFSLLPPGTEPGSTRPNLHYEAEDHWSLARDAFAPDALGVQRRRDQLSINADGAAVRHMAMVIPPTESLTQRAAVRQALAATLREFPRFRPLVFYRQRLSYAIGAAAVASLLAWLWIRRRAGRLPVLVGLLGLAWWIVAAVWIHGVYLAT